jgi:hypothetical protein
VKDGKTKSNSSHNVLGRMTRVFAAVAVLSAPASAAGVNPTLSADDVSWLFPAPHNTTDLANLIAMKDLGGANVVWSPTVFQKFLSLVESKASFVEELNAQIGLPPDAHKIDAWFVAGVRFDPGAPGLDPAITEQFGQLPEIRLIVQPVSVSGGSVTIHDYAVHLIFDFVTPGTPAQPGCRPRLLPDQTAFNSIMSDVTDLKNKLASGSIGAVPITTAGLPLGVHPGLQNAATATAVVQAMRAVLERHLAAARLDAMSVVGTPATAPVPWIFLSMLVVPGSQVVVPVPSPTLDGTRFALALSHPHGAPLAVVPAPATNNGVIATCKSAALGPGGLPATVRHGVATADLFPKTPASRDEVLAVTGTIANPSRSHFFNTDCASCHTETRLLQHQNLSPAGIDPAVLPSGDWVVRNFGWSPSGQATVTRRAAAETQAVVDFLNSAGH